MGTEAANGGLNISRRKQRKALKFLTVNCSCFGNYLPKVWYFFNCLVIFYQIPQRTPSHWFFCLV